MTPLALPVAEEKSERELREALRRCPPETLAAVRRFRRTRQSKEIPVILRGVLTRYVDADQRARLKTGPGSLRLGDDLGLDSLSLIEVSMALEDVLGITLNDDELRKLQTIDDVENYARGRLAAKA